MATKWLVIGVLEWGGIRELFTWQKRIQSDHYYYSNLIHIRGRLYQVPGKRIKMTNYWGIRFQFEGLSVRNRVWMTGLLELWVRSLYSDKAIVWVLLNRAIYVAMPTNTLSQCILSFQWKTPTPCDCIIQAIRLIKWKIKNAHHMGTSLSAFTSVRCIRALTQTDAMWS